MTDLKPLIANLRKLASAATPGPWRWDNDEQHGFANVDTGVDPDQDDARVNNVFSVYNDGNNFHDNGPYIAAANPETILRLCDELEAYIDADLDAKWDGTP